jgi:hypothetical protein
MKILDSFQEAVETLYQDSLGIKLSDSDSDGDNTPQWRRVSADNFLQAGDNVGLLLDPEIGLALFVLEHHIGNDLNAEIRQALKISDKLQPAYQPDSDEQGTWQVGLLWLVEGDDLEESWKGAIAERRKQSGFSEELALDAVFYDRLDSVQAEILKHGLPQLLLQTRKLFGMDQDSMSNWHSANGEVAEMLRTFPLRFKNTAANEIAARLVEQALAQVISSEIEPYPESPESVTHLKVRNFRNIESCDLLLHNSPRQDAVVPKVVFGPNGTGKTALFEALSLALCGSSRKLQNYLEDTDVVPRKPYLEQVLRPLKVGAANPEVCLNGGVWPIFADNPKIAREQLQVIEGTLLEQEVSQMFAYIDRGNLAAQVLRGYSTLADFVQQKAEEGYQQEHSRRQRLLAEYGLNQGIRKIETLRERVLDKVLGKELPAPPPSLLSWLSRIGNLLPEGRRWLDLSAGWKYWSDESVKNSFAEFIKTNNSSVLNSALFARVLRRRQLVDDTQKALDSLRTQAGTLREDVDAVIADLAMWVTWLEQQSTAPSPTDVEQELVGLQTTLALRQHEREKLAAQGKVLRGRQEHLQKTHQFLETWAATHPAECPTCGADHADHGGILAVTIDLQGTNDQQLEELRQQYVQINTVIKEIETRMVVLGQAACPISVERREEIGELLHGIAPDNAMDIWLKNPEERQRVIGVLQNLQVLPTLPALPEDDSLESERISQEILSRLIEADSIWEAPEHWDEVKKKLSAACLEIVQSHMPRTLQAVWSELLFVLTPARWNLVAEPKFDFKLSRGNNEMRVVTEKNDRKVLARYLFNQAEIHLLGLAWFFMRYFSHGRFRYALIAMDDPAQEMDQTTYRAFTRFLQTLTRLHRQHQRPFSMLIFLHQEDRALDAARAMDAVLDVLGWEKEHSENGEHKHVMSEIKLVSEQFRPANAISLFKKSEAQLVR